jgi:hypothetical protein
MAKPYILQPDYRLTVGLGPQPTDQDAIGEVVGSDWVGMRQLEVGHTQAWHYPQDRTLILWECLLEHRHRKADPRTDKTLRAIWLGFEGFLLRRIPDVERIVTPSWEPIYEEDKDAWPHFLETLGYGQISERAYCKEVREESEEEPATP